MWSDRPVNGKVLHSKNEMSALRVTKFKIFDLLCGKWKFFKVKMKNQFYHNHNLNCEKFKSGKLKK